MFEDSVQSSGKDSVNLEVGPKQVDKKVHRTGYFLRRLTFFVANKHILFFPSQN